MTNLTGRVRLVAVAAALLLSASLAAAQVASISRVSLCADGQQVDDDSLSSALSADGAWAAFLSVSPNLVPGDTNGVADVFVRSLREGLTERVSMAWDGSQANGWCYEAQVSSGARAVMFSSDADNLVPGDTNGFIDVFVVDREAGTIERVSVGNEGQQGDLPSTEPSLSADGRFVAFTTRSVTIDPLAGDHVQRIYLRDRIAGTTTLVSRGLHGQLSNGDSWDPSVSADGRWVAFSSHAANLVPGDTNNSRDVFVHDTRSGTTRRVSVASGGQQVVGTSLGPSISDDGRFVSFTSYSPLLVPGDSNASTDVFVHDVLTLVTTRVSVSTLGEQGDNHSSSAALAGNGRWVVFHSDASTLVPSDTNGHQDVFLHHRATGVTQRVSQSSHADPGNLHSSLPSISSDGQRVAFESFATNLVPGDTNGERDIFVRTHVEH